MSGPPEVLGCALDNRIKRVQEMHGRSGKEDLQNNTAHYKCMADKLTCEFGGKKDPKFQKAHKECEKEDSTKFKE